MRRRLPKHAGGDGSTMKKDGSWKGTPKTPEEEEATPTDRFRKPKP